MAERRPPGFNVPLGFYDGPEVKSIPRRIRAAAVGVWTLCGAFSANKLQDGYVDAETLKDLGCTPAIRAALKATKGSDGEPDPLWVEARDGGVQFTKWVKYQRSRAEVKAYRDADAERKRNERKSSKGAVTSNDSRMSGRTSAGHRSDDREPKTETETETYSAEVEHAQSRNVGEPRGPERGQERGRSDPVDPSASRLVATLIPSNIPAAVKTALRLSASQLMVGDRMPAEVVAESLRRWAAKPGSGTGLLPHIAADVVREQTALAQSGGRSTGGLTAGEAKVAGWAALGVNPTPAHTDRKAIGQ